MNGAERRIVGFMVVGFALNFVIGTLAYFLLSKLTAMRRVEPDWTPVPTG